jgi:MYXO-CTERM domain-containing protein
VRFERCLLALLLFPAARSTAQTTVAVDPTQDAHTISDLIYGINYPTDAQIAAGITVARWGGNATTRYNYQIDVTNTGADYYFENLAGCWSPAASYCANPPADPKTNSGANAFLASAQQKGLVALFTMPTMGWIAKAPPKYAHPFDCGCPATALPTQRSFDQYDTNCGDGHDGAGNWLTCPSPTLTSTPVDASWTGQWAAYILAKFGPSRRRIYALDNEPNLWSSTHHDAHPSKLTYDELWQRMRDNAVAIRAADPMAMISGPAEWGWPNYFCSDADDVSQGCSAASPDRAAHGGTELMAWLLQQAKAYEMTNHERLLDYLDLHYYPQGGNPPEITRSLWDPSYVDPSWINDKIRLIPRMRDWVAQNYPGTQISISEYDFAHHNEAIGAVTYAEVLGIFAREGLDMATAWSAPADNEIAFSAYRLYRNYDGHGATFGSIYARTTITGGTGIQAFAAVRPGKLTVVLINENNAASTVSVTTGAFQAAGVAHLFAGAGAMIAPKPDVTLQGGAASVALDPTSIALVEFSGTAPSVDGGSSDGAGSEDAAASSDSGSSDSGGATGQDAAVSPDAGSSPDSGSSASSSGKCGCSSTRDPARPPAWALLLFALLVRRPAIGSRSKQ